VRTRRLRSWIAAAFVWAVATALAPEAVAHDGDLDGQGCHHGRQLGGYHCHRGPLAGRSFAAESEARKALAGAPPAAGERTKALPLRSGRALPWPPSALQR
jgi:hypothetical protein